MIINLTGLPGCGKTTLEPYFISGFRERNFNPILNSEIKNCYIQEKIFSRFCRQSWFGIMPRLFFLFKVRGGYFNRCLSNKMIRLFFYEINRIRGYRVSGDIILSEYFLNEYARGLADKNILFCEEGLIHHLASMKVWSGNSPDLFKFFLNEGQMCRGFHIFYIKVPLEMVYERLIHRGIPTFWSKNISREILDIKEILKKYEWAIESTIEEFSSRGAHVETIDNSGDESLINQRVEKCLDSFVKTMNKMSAGQPLAASPTL